MPKLFVPLGLTLLSPRRTQLLSTGRFEGCRSWCAETGWVDGGKCQAVEQGWLAIGQEALGARGAEGDRYVGQHRWDATQASHRDSEKRGEW